MFVVIFPFSFQLHTIGGGISRDGVLFLVKWFNFYFFTSLTEDSPNKWMLMETYVDICNVTFHNAASDFEEDDVDASEAMTGDDMLLFRRGDDGGLEREGGGHDGRGDRGRVQHPGGLAEQQLLCKQLQVRLTSSRSSTFYF